MKKIGGNVTALIQVRESTKNEIGERVIEWVTVQSIKGFLDFLSGESTRSNYKSRIEESTHVFICDYVHMNSRITDENSRLLIGDKAYEVKMIDDPIGLHYQLEFSLKYTGGE